VLLVALPLATFGAVFLWNGGPQAEAAPATFRGDTEQAEFDQCVGGHRVTCVVDGDTIWYQGTKIRIADINTPEVSEPQCAYEAQLGARATERLTGLLNAGPFSFAPIDRAYDKYGRRLLVVTRQGRSLGDTLVAEGLAERWRGYRRSWCN
jgi:endonuclease YncB( thermonuclease family)